MKCDLLYWAVQSAEGVWLAYEYMRSLPMVGMVVTISPSLSLYKMVVLPAASSPTCSARAEQSARSWDGSSVRYTTSVCRSTHHEDPHLLLGEKPLKQLREGDPHLSHGCQAFTNRYRRGTPKQQLKG